MMDNENQNQPNQKISFESLDILIGKWRDGTFSEIIDDWKWIFSYSKRYKGAIAFYTILGIFSTSMGLVGSVRFFHFLPFPLLHLSSAKFHQQFLCSTHYPQPAESFFLCSLILTTSPDNFLLFFLFFLVSNEKLVCRALFMVKEKAEMRKGES